MKKVEEKNQEKITFENLTLNDIQKAKDRLSLIALKTEMGFSNSASTLLNNKSYFKFENQQRTGSFKIRGAYNKIVNLTEEEKSKGVIACSAGNHAQGVALSAKLLNVQSTVVMPETAPLNKLMATQSYGAQVVRKGETFDEALTYARELEKEKNFTFVHPFEDPLIVAGQGTLGLEILEQLPDIDHLVVPIGGGGLISGIALAIKSLKPKVKIYGVQSVQTPGMVELFHKKEYQKRNFRTSTIADGIAVKSPSSILLKNFIEKFVEDIVTVTDDEIAEAMVYLLERAKTLTEGSGAVGLAAAMNQKIKLSGNSCFLLSGGNIDLNIVSQVILRGQIKRSRLIEISVLVDDLPGNLSRLTQLFAQERANILEVHHDRVGGELFLRETNIDFILEVSGEDHIAKIKNALLSAGIRVRG
ncbi:MAG TPA: threonine ammonia-lyase [Pseudobdellovibrionaceae bacterium]|nr:threonine ammonia-lyase [Pseudobdellovibrionaceae bacterium]